MRDWKAILTDAKERGISRVALARELGIGRGEVNNAAKFHKIDLPNAPKYMKGRTTPRTEEERQRQRDNARRRWERTFAAAPPGLTLNAFCFRYGCGADTAHKWASEFGYEFGGKVRAA